jgi:hypothetical protein
MFLEGAVRKIKRCCNDLERVFVSQRYRSDHPSPLDRFSQDRLAGQRTICDGRNDETGAQDDHDPGQRVHSVIGRVFSEQQAQQTGSDNGANVLRSAQQSGGGSHFLVRRLHIERRLIRVGANSLGKAERQNQKYKERCRGISCNQRNAASDEQKTQGSEDQRTTCFSSAHQRERREPRGRT